MRHDLVISPRDARITGAMDDIPHDLELLLLCSRLELGPSEGERARELAAQVTDWPRLARLAEERGVLPLLYWQLERLGAGAGVPPPVWAALGKRYRHLALLNGRVRRHFLAEILEALQSRGVTPIVMKGAYLAEHVYPDVALRPMDDTDLLVREEQLEAARTALEDIGYAPKAEYFLTLDTKHLPVLAKRGNPYGVDVHWQPAVGGHFDVDLTAVWDRARPAQVAGRPVLAFAPEDQLLHLSIHMVYEHAFNARLFVLTDLAGVVRQGGGLEWDVFVASARAWGAAKCGWLALQLARELAGAPVPEEVLSALHAEGDERWLPVVRQAMLYRAQPAALLPERFWRVLSAPTAGARLAALREGVTASGGEWRATDAPARPMRRTPAFYVQRAGRLLRTYVPPLVRLVRHPRRVGLAREQAQAQQDLMRWLTS